MNEKKRVALSIFGFVVVGALFIVAGIYGIDRMEVQASNVSVSATALSEATPESVGLDGNRLSQIDRVVEEYLDEGAFPGAVIGVIRDGKMVYKKSYGHRQVAGAKQPMTLDTRFDLASLTKPVAVATSVMQLVEQGKICLGDRVDKYIPKFRGWAATETPKDTVQIRVVDLLTHTSGLPPYVSPSKILAENPEAKLPNPDVVISYITRCDRWAVARTKCIYSCLNYIVLGRIVEVVTGESIDKYAEENIFEPLGMSNTRYLPDAQYAAMCAPTEKSGKAPGIVNDPLSHDGMGGVSGNAGLFSTLDDLAIYVSMLLDRGSWQGVDILSPRGVNAILTRPMGYETFGRTIGWENYAACSQTGGDLFTPAAIGHTGATGTSIVIDPELDMAVIILTNYVHSSSKRTLLDFRSKISTVVAASVRW